MYFCQHRCFTRHSTNDKSKSRLSSLRVHWMGLMSLDDSLTVSRMRYPYETAVTVQDFHSHPSVSPAHELDCCWKWNKNLIHPLVLTCMEGLLCHCTPVIPSTLTTARQQAKQKVTSGTWDRTAKIVSTIGQFGDVYWRCDWGYWLEITSIDRMLNKHHFWHLQRRLFKGTMSHLQAKKMKALNSNCIWKIILI